MWLCKFAGVVAVAVVLTSDSKEEYYARSIASAKGRAWATRDGSKQFLSTVHDSPKGPRKVSRGSVGEVSEKLASRC